MTPSYLTLMVICWFERISTLDDFKGSCDGFLAHNRQPALPLRSKAGCW